MINRQVSKKRYTENFVAAMSFFTIFATTAHGQTVAAQLEDQPLRAEKFDQNAFRTVFRHERKIVNDVNLHYVIGGSGPPVILLHGWPTTWFEWWRIMGPLAQQGFTVVAPDLRGLGASEKTQSGYEKATLAEDVYQLVRELGYDEIYLVGHDWGNSTAYALARAHPEIIAHYVATENTIPGLGDWDEINRSAWHHLFHSEATDLAIELIRGREETYFGYFFDSYTGDLETFDDDYRDRFLDAYTKPGALRTSLQYYAALDHDAELNARTSDQILKVPTTVVSGSLATDRTLHEQLKPVVDDYNGYVLEGCGHFLSIECPDELMPILLRAFGRVP